VRISDVGVLGVQEFFDTAKGIEALDAMVKAAPVSIVTVLTVTPARFVVLLTGDVASVQSALEAGRRTGGQSLVDELFLANLHPWVLPAISGEVEDGDWDALGILEAASITSGIEAGDLAAKRADVRLVEIRLDSHLGGRSTVKMVGPLDEVQAAMEVAVSSISAKRMLVRSVVIPRPHPDIKPFYRTAAAERGA